MAHNLDCIVDRPPTSNPSHLRTMLLAAAVPILAVVTACGSSTSTATAPSTISRCGVALGPSTVTVPAEGAIGRITVTTARECAWTAAVEGGWLSIIGPNSGQGDGGIEYQAASNADPVTRRASITLNDQRLEVTQAAGTCVLTLREAAASFSPAGGSGTIDVVASSPLCTWTVTADEAWITFTTSANGKGSAAVRYLVAPTTGPPRTATITVGTQRFSIVQAEGCSYAISPASGSVPSAGGSGTVAVSTSAGCPWTAASNASWIAVTSGASGNGPGTVSFAADPLQGPPRSGTLVIAGQTFTLAQSSGCSYEVTPLTHAAPAGGGPFTISVNTGPGCGWEASSAVPWLTFSGPASRTGTGSLTVTVAPASGAERSGSLTVAGQTVTVLQAQACSFTIAPESQSVPVSGGSGTVSVTATAGCAWTARSEVNWITITEGANGNGNGTVRFSVAASGGASRSGALTIAGRTFTVSQGQACTFTIDPERASAPAAGGTVTVNVGAASGCAWTTVSGAPWLTVRDGASGTGNGTVRIEAAPNTGAPRSGTVTIAGQTFTVEQASACAYTLSSEVLNVAAAGGTGTVDVTAAGGCAWTAQTNVPWITITSGSSGSGTGRVAFTVAANTGPSRTGTITIAGRTFTVTQGGGCSYTIAPQQHAAAAEGGGVTVEVTTTAVCAWTAVSQVPWMVVAEGASGTGSGVVQLTIAANNGSARTGSVAIAGQTFTVQQAAPCTYTLAPPSRTTGRQGGPGMFNVNTDSGCTWTALSTVPWIAIVGPSSGSGGARVDYVVQPNDSGAERTGSITVQGQSFVVVQSGS